jgi:hypothetical protein
MTERTAYISLFVTVLVLEMVLVVGLNFLGAGSEAIANAVVLLAAAAGLAVGLIGVRYH